MAKAKKSEVSVETETKEEKTEPKAPAKAEKIDLKKVFIVAGVSALGFWALFGGENGKKANETTGNDLGNSNSSDPGRKYRGIDTFLS